MEASSFKRGLARALLANGFGRSGKVYSRDRADVVTLVEFQHGFGSQWFVDVGFWMRALHPQVPSRVAQSHVYVRLDRLFDEHADMILKACALEEGGQEQSYTELLQLIEGPLSEQLRVFETRDGLLRALLQGRLDHAFVRREAREYLGQ